MAKEKLLINTEKIKAEARNDGITHFVVGIAIIKSEKVLVLRRTPHDFMGGNFELPGGGVEENESFEEAVTRETFEETGLHVIAILEMITGFDYQTPRKKVRQINFIVSTEGEEVQLHPEEHDQFLWIRETELDSLVMSNEMKDSIRRIFLKVKI